MLETMKERKKHIQGLSDSELKEYFNDLCECNKEQDKEIEEIRRNFCRLSLRTPRHVVESNLYTIEMNDFLIALAKEELESRKDKYVLKSVITSELFNIFSENDVKIDVILQSEEDGSLVNIFYRVAAEDVEAKVKEIKKRYGK